MTPAQYEQRCAEMLRANAHNMTDDEVERFAYGSGVKFPQRTFRTIAELNQNEKTDSEELADKEARIDRLENAIREAQRALDYAL